MDDVVRRARVAAGRLTALARRDAPAAAAAADRLVVLEVPVQPAAAFFRRPAVTTPRRRRDLDTAADTRRRLPPALRAPRRGHRDLDLRDPRPGSERDADRADPDAARRRRVRDVTDDVIRRRFDDDDVAAADDDDRRRRLLPDDDDVDFDVELHLLVELLAATHSVNTHGVYGYGYS